MSNRAPAPSAEPWWRRKLYVVLVLLLVVAGSWWAVSGGQRWRTMRAVQAFVDPGIDAAHSFRELLAAHPHLSDPAWTAGWSDDDALVSVEVQVQSFDELRKNHGSLVAPFLDQVAKTANWSGVAGDQPARLLIAFQATTGGDDTGTLQVNILSVRLTEAWVVFRPEQAEAFSASLETAIEHADDGRRAKQYRLRRDGDRALFNAGLDGPMLAGAGMEIEARSAFIALSRWR